MSNPNDFTSLEEISSLAEKVINKSSSILEWFKLPSEEAWNSLLKLIQGMDNLTPPEQIALIYNSRKLVREYGNSKAIFDEAKRHFEENAEGKSVDEDWLHFFFDKAEKVSTKSMQMLWAKMLSGEFNKPGTISRKLIHIISIMDVNSAKSFQTFCYYIFEPKRLLYSSYKTYSVLLPQGFYENSFDFLRETENWLKEAGFENFRELASQLTMTTGELNSLENLGLIQTRQEVKNGVPLFYQIDKENSIWLIPEDNEEFPMGKYTLTSEGQQLYDIIRGKGNKACIEIVIQYLKKCGMKFRTSEYFSEIRV